MFHVYLIALCLHHVLMVVILTSLFLLVLVFLGLRCCLSSVLSGCFPFFLFYFSYNLLSYVLSESYLKRVFKVFFYNLFSSGFDRMHCESSLLCINVKMDCLQLLLKVFEQTWSDFALQKAFRVLIQLVFQAKHSSCNVQKRPGSKQI